MGWISDRRMKTGHGLAHGHKKTARSKAPLKKIVETISFAKTMFEQNHVILECGHKTFSNGMHRARCLKCLKEENERTD